MDAAIIDNLILRELEGKVKPVHGGSLLSLLGGLGKKLLPQIIKHAPKILGTLGLAAASGAVSGATEKSVKGKGIDSKYVEYGFDLSPGQIRKLSKATGPHTIRLSHDKLTGPSTLRLTKTQYNKILRAQRKMRGVQITLSHDQIQANGGFLGALLAGVAAPLIGKVLGFGQGDGLRLPGEGLRLPGEGLRLPGEGLRLPGSGLTKKKRAR